MIVEKQRETRARTRPLGFAIGAAAVAAVLAAFSPASPHLFPAAFPQDPEKQQALESCSRADPTFVRFLAANRDACYERFSNLTVAAAGVLRPGFRQSVVNSTRH
jgi:hypothetical protein